MAYPYSAVRLKAIRCGLMMTDADNDLHHANDAPKRMMLMMLDSFGPADLDSDHEDL